ncbi:MAG TPA: hypothetical protein VD905_21245 [Flavobacteriales bacterium]|nr:hypothetical protein [Flavobacteriales bacterium]
MKKLIILGAGLFFSATSLEAQNTNPWPSSGFVGIGTASPLQQLHVVGKTRFDANATGSGGGRFYLTRPNNTQYECLLSFGTNGTGSYDWTMGTPYVSGGSNDYIMNTWSAGRVLTALYSNGNLGIGGSTTVGTSPTAKLSVNGDFLVSSSGITGAPYIYHNPLYGTATSPEYGWYSTPGLGMYHTSATSLSFSANNTEVMRIGNGTNPFVGIGTTNPIAPLTVNGKVLIGNPAQINVTTTNPYLLYVQTGILTEKVKVALYNTSDWSDYVFANNYRLMPLNEVKQFVEKNKHLPGIPSAEELVKEGGFDLGEMDAKLLEKVEELTLYILQLKEENQKLENRLSELEKRN